MKIAVNNLVKTYTTRDKSTKELHALNDVSISVENGEFCVIVGESGSGKSTLARIITGLIPKTSGEVLIDGEEITPEIRQKNKSISAKIQLVLQDGKSALDPHFAIYRCIAEPLRNLCKMTKEQEKERVLELLKQMELSEDILKRKPHELSGGQQKRVCIARALATRPDILIFDEAISGLDVIVRKSILDLLKKIHNESGSTVLFITHDIDVALYMATRIIVMKDGEIVENVKNTGSPDCLAHSYSRTLAAAMLPEAVKNAFKA